MFSFFRKNIDVPEWAAFFTPAEYGRFDRELNNYFQSLNVDYIIDDGVAKVNDPLLGENLGLYNLAQVCKQNRRRNYKDIIKTHFEAMIKTKAFEIEFDKISEDYEAVKKYIGVRLYPIEYVEQLGKALTLGFDFSSDIYAMLVFDFPDSVLSVQPEQIKPWNKSVEALLEEGIQNIKRKYPITLTREKLKDTFFFFLESNHFFVPNVIFDIESYSELKGTYGSLVGLPHRHCALFYPIENLEVVEVINLLIPIIYGMEQEGPGSLSHTLFWLHEGSFIELPYTITDDSIKFTPPDNFVDMLNKIS